MSAATRGRASRRAPAQRSPQAMSTEDFLRTVVFAKRPRNEQPATAPGNAASAVPPAPAPSLPAPNAPDSRAGAAASASAPQSGDIPPALDVQCAFSPDGRLRAKQERCGGRAASYDYTHDGRGHLTEVRRDGQVAERYTYNTRASASRQG